MSELALIVTAHNETAVCGPTMRSADRAVEIARDGGVQVRTIVALDRASEATTEYFLQDRFAHWERTAFDEGDLGLVRNAIAAEVDAPYLAFLDADDLFSENWLLEGVRRLRRADALGERVIAHPELNVVFDGGTSVVRIVESDSALFTPYLCYVRNYWDALCLAPRVAYLEHPYHHNDLSNGLAYEDWQFGLDTLAGGWKHVVVPDTIIFKRRRDESLLRSTASRGAITRSGPALAIDRIGQLGRGAVAD